MFLSKPVNRFYCYCDYLGLHCIKSVRILSYSGPHFPEFGLNTLYLSVLSRNAGKCGPE